MLSDHHARDLHFDGVGARESEPARTAAALAEALRGWAAAHPEARLQQLTFASLGEHGLAALLAYTDGAPAPEAQEAIAAAMEELRTTQPEIPDPPPPFV